MATIGITVKFPHKIPDLGLTFTVIEGLTCEDILKSCIEHIENLVSCEESDKRLSAVFISAFGLLRLPERKSYVAPFHVFNQHCENGNTFEFRVRHRPLADTFVEGNVLCEYLLLQLLDDFLKGSLCTTKKTDRQDILVYIALALMIPTQLPKKNSTLLSAEYNIPFSLKSYKKLLSKELYSILNKGKWADKWIDHYHLYRTFKEKFCYYKKQNLDLLWYKNTLWTKLLQLYPEYCFEKYENVLLVENNVKKKTNVFLNVYNEASQEKGLFVLEQKTELTDIKKIKMEKPSSLDSKEWTVTISLDPTVVLRKDWDRPDKIVIAFTEEGMAESFISMLQGYLSLTRAADVYYFPDLVARSSKAKAKLKAFGYLRHETAQRFLQQEFQQVKRDCGHIIYQSITTCGKLCIMSRSKDKPVGFIESLPGDKLMLSIDGEDDVVTAADEIRRQLNDKFGKQICASSAAQQSLIVDNIFTSDSYDQVDKNRVGLSVNTFQGAPTFYMAEDFDMATKTLISEDGFVVKHRVALKAKQNSNFGDMTMVELLPHCETVSHAFREGMRNHSGLCRCNPLRITQFYAQVQSRNFTYIEEFSPMNLIQYLEKRTSTLAHKVDIAKQVIAILEVLQNCLSDFKHGDLQCSNIMVFPQGPRDIQIKLGSPGVVTHFQSLGIEDPHTDERIPWIAPELYNNLSDVTIQTELYAAGTVFCEIMHSSNNFRRLLKLSKKEKIYPVYKGKKHLQFLEPKLSVSNKDSEAVLHGVRDIGTSIWKKIILECWSDDPRERPDCTALLDLFVGIENDLAEFPEEKEVDVMRNILTVIGNHPIQQRSKQSTPSEYEQHLSSCCKHYRHGSCFKIIAMNIGKGHFGIVHKALMREPKTHYASSEGETTLVAIKQLSMKEADATELLRELCVGQRLQHDNIVSTICFTRLDCIMNYGTSTCLVMEYMDKGTLKNYVMAHKEKMRDIGHRKVLLKFCLDVVKAMVYIGGMHHVHRDLAARNVLLKSTPSNGFVAKVSDFGLARVMKDDVRFYYQMSNTTIAVGGLPPELLNNEDHRGLRFDSKVDVWAFGTLMWETFSQGKKPLNVIEQQIRAFGCKDLYQLYTKHKWKLPCEKYVDKNVYAIMEACWTVNKQQRPAFVELEQRITHLLATHFSFK